MSDTESDIETATDSAYEDSADYTSESDGESSEIFVPELDVDEPDEDEEEEGEEIDTETYSIAPSTESKREEWALRMQNESFCYQRDDPVEVPADQRRSEPVMTVYEMVRVIGVRSQQLQTGAPCLVQGANDLTYSQMAYIELISNKSPCIIKRYMPAGRYELWRVSELRIIHRFDDPYYSPPGYVESVAVDEKKKRE